MKKFILFVIPILLIGCKGPKEIIKEIPVEIIKTEYKDIYHFDSIYLHDSINTYIKGDTVYRDKFQYKYIEKQVHDTLITHDTIPKTIYETQIVEKKVAQWWPVWLMLGIIVCGGIAYIFKKFNIIDIIKKWIGQL